jgi:[ribosomal protein S5]-alanine N-acetyltransferase
MIWSVTGKPVACGWTADEHRPVEIVTPRLLLRDFSDADHASLHLSASDPEVTRYMDWGPNTVEDTAAFLAWARANAAGRPRALFNLAVVERGDGGLLGSVSLRVISPDHQRAEMGYMLARSRWGCGYGTEAARAVLGFALDKLRLHKVTATCDPENVGSARVLSKIGMHREGYLRDHLLIRGQWRDRLLFAAVADE